MGTDVKRAPPTWSHLVAPSVVLALLHSYPIACRVSVYAHPEQVRPGVNVHLVAPRQI